MPALSRLPRCPARRWRAVKRNQAQRCDCADASRHPCLRRFSGSTAMTGARPRATPRRQRAERAAARIAQPSRDGGWRQRQTLRGRRGTPGSGPVMRPGSQPFFRIRRAALAARSYEGEQVGTSCVDVTATCRCRPRSSAVLTSRNVTRSMCRRMQEGAFDQRRASRRAIP